MPSDLLMLPRPEVMLRIRTSFARSEDERRVEITFAGPRMLVEISRWRSSGFMVRLDW